MTRFLTAAAAAIVLAAGAANAATVTNRDATTHVVYWYDGDAGDMVYVPAGGTAKICGGCTLSIGGASFEASGSDQFEIINGKAQQIR